MYLRINKTPSLGAEALFSFVNNAINYLNSALADQTRVRPNALRVRPANICILFRIAKHNCVC